MKAEYREVVRKELVAPDGYGFAGVGVTQPGDLELDDSEHRLERRVWKPARIGLSCAIGVVIARPLRKPLSERG